MTDHSVDGDIKDSGTEASPMPETTAASEMKATSEVSSESPPFAAARTPSKEITLQRLTSHSSWEDYVRDETQREHVHAAAASAESNNRRLMPLAAIVAVAAVVGAIGGSLATANFGHKDDQATAAIAALAAEQSRSVEAAIGKINIDIAALKANSSAQSAKIVERIDRVEKAQAEPAAKLAKLSDAVEKLRAPTPAPASSQDTTGSIKSAATPPAVAQPARLPIVEGWTLREVSDGIATVTGRQGIFDVMPGDPLPGIGRVDAIRRQDGRWVVVTSRGLIIAR